MDWAGRESSPPDAALDSARWRISAAQLDAAYEAAQADKSLPQIEADLSAAVDDVIAAWKALK